MFALSVYHLQEHNQDVERKTDRLGTSLFLSAKIIVSLESTKWSFALRQKNLRLLSMTLNFAVSGIGWKRLTWPTFRLSAGFRSILCFLFGFLWLETLKSALAFSSIASIMQSIESAIDEFTASESGQSPSHHQPVSPIECFADAVAVDALGANDDDNEEDNGRNDDRRLLSSSSSGHLDTLRAPTESPNSSTSNLSPLSSDQGN